MSPAVAYLEITFSTPVSLTLRQSPDPATFNAAALGTYSQVNIETLIPGYDIPFCGTVTPDGNGGGNTDGFANFLDVSDTLTSGGSSYAIEIGGTC
ncbi:MAG TPA: hypothetical protein VME66_10965 [Candidatus Acidoferrales bacterium]|nr:hypothetical protein [Candidatus Acidoferrales bacterium]